MRSYWLYRPAQETDRWGTDAVITGGTKGADKMMQLKRKKRQASRKGISRWGFGGNDRKGMWCFIKHFDHGKNAT